MLNERRAADGGEEANIVLETLRQAAVRRLCVELKYAGTRRLVEPYALRFTGKGELLLSARRVDSKNLRTYRVDRIEEAMEVVRSLS